ncbi:concanavalin A-like lectin/glucanase domain-containing protein, partial [Coniella lustricola]
LFPCPVLADCECGYRFTTPATNSTPAAQSFIVTDLIETNFFNITGDISHNTDWIAQNWSEDASVARGAYGEMMNVANVLTAAAATEKEDVDDSNDKAGGGADKKGLQITVVGEPTADGDVQGGEIDTARLDVFYGTFRASMKLTGVAGTASAFFWYYNNTQEIDMEFLSREFSTDNESYPVNLVLQSSAAAKAGYNAADTDTYRIVNLPFDPRSDFHEYRIDWLSQRVLFYAQGVLLAEMDDPNGVPTHAGHLSINQWSNGNADWSGGPPSQDAVLEVGYVKAYFNSSEEGRQKDFEKRCGAGDKGTVCDIPEVSEGNSSAAGWFFSGQKNMTANQTVSG